MNWLKLNTFSSSTKFSYYPFGLTMKAISSQAAGALQNKFKYNGIELDTTFGLNEYEAHFRDLDPTIGRWWQIDPKIHDGYESMSPYMSMYNNPVRYSDPFGNEADENSGVNSSPPHSLLTRKHF